LYYPGYYRFPMVPAFRGINIFATYLGEYYLDYRFDFFFAREGSHVYVYSIDRHHINMEHIITILLEYGFHLMFENFDENLNITNKIFYNSDEDVSLIFDFDWNFAMVSLTIQLSPTMDELFQNG